MKEKATKNIITSVLFKILILFIGLFSRRYLVNYLGDDITGLYSLFISILGFLSVAELGIGTAIIFSMYKPITENDTDKVSSLYYLYKKIYFYIFSIILVVGLLLTPLIPLFAKDINANVNIYLTYIIFLLTSLISYLFAHKTSFINAHMDNYITNSIRSIYQIFEFIIQIFVIIYTKSFTYFLLVLLVSNLLQWVTTNLIFAKKYKHQLNNNKILNEELKVDVVKKTKAMFFHKIGGLLVMTTDNLIISAFISVSLLGKYSNYTLIINNLVGILALVFSSIITILGHSYAKYGKAVFNEQFKKVYLINYLTGLVFFLGFYSINKELILIIFNENVVLDNNIIIVVTINYFIQFMRQTALSFRDASGTFYNDRYKPLVEGVTNLVLSLILVKFYGIIGVLAATIFTNIFITHIVEPFVLYKHGFEKSPKKYYIYNYLGILLFISLVIGFNYLKIPTFNSIYVTLLVKGTLSVLISSMTILLLLVISKTFRTNFNNLIKELLKFIRK